MIGALEAANFAAAARFTMLLSGASTRMILQFWQMACTVSTSRAISTSQPGETAEPGGAPRLIFLKHDVVTDEVHLGSTGSPYVWEYFLRSAAMVASSNASTIATVAPAGPLTGRLYALW